jgi:nitrate/nitrite transporter NarK
MRAAFSGFVSTGGQTGGFFAPIVVGYIVKSTGSFRGGFLFMIAALCGSALCYLALTPYVLKIRKAQSTPQLAREMPQLNHGVRYVPDEQ